MTSVNNVIAYPDEPEIESFEPVLAFILNTTFMSLTVKNHSSFIKNHTMVVTVAGYNCGNPKTYKNDIIICTLKQSGNPNRISGPVIVEYKSLDPATLESKTIKSKQQFDFVEPEVKQCNPKCVSTRGATLIHITGKFLNCTKDVKVYVTIGNKIKIPFEIVSKNSTHIGCSTGASVRAATGKLIIAFNNRMLLLINDFQYIGEPALEREQTFAGIASGGIRLMLLGVDFSCTRNLMMYVDCNETKISSQCRRVENDAKTIACQTPNLDGRCIGSSVTALPLTIKVDTEDTDNVVLNATDKIDYLVYPDPSYTDFEVNGIMVTVNGKFLYSDYHPDDVVIRLPNSTDDECTVIAVTKKSIICQTTSPMSSFVSAKDILVVIGNNRVDIVQRRLLPSLETSSQMVSVLCKGSIALVIITLLLGLLVYLRIILMKSKNQSEKRYIQLLKNITAGMDER